jgi:hypothetical protein
LSSARFLAALVVALGTSLAHAVAPAATPALDLDVELDPATRRLQAVAVVAPESRRFRFQLHESLQVRAASAGGSALVVSAAGRQGATRGWEVQLPAGATTVRLEYGGTLPPLDPSLDHRDVLRRLPPMVAADGSFLPAGSGWYPEPAGQFSYRVSLSVPAAQRALVAGGLVSEEVPATAAGRYRARFEFAQATDGIELMAGPWVVRERTMPRAGAAPVRLRTYFPRDLDAMPGLADGYLDDTRRYLELYSDEIGAYPFTEFSIVAGPLPTGFGMPTLTYLGVDVVKLPFIRATSLGHEVLHSWWGNGVRVDYAQGNWSEGLTTFMADYAYKERESAAAARDARLAWLRDFAAVPDGAQQSLASFRSRTHGADAAVGYGKAAMVFVMLKDEIGGDAFRRGIRSFWAKHRFRAAGWSDLRSAFEQASGRSLQAFFAQWVERAGGPAVRITGASARALAPGTDAGPSAGREAMRLTIAVEQSAPAYALRLPIAIAFPGRTETRWVDVSRERDVATIDVDARPEGVRLDPDLRVWRRLDPQQLPPILRQWIVARAPRLVQASAAPEVRAAAAALGTRLCEIPPVEVAASALAQGQEPLLLMGVHADVDAALARAGLPPRPAEVAGRGSAQVWTIARGSGAPVAVVSAADADALAALQRPLPHYGGQSWLVFDGARMLERGIWSAAGPPVPVTGSR